VWIQAIRVDKPRKLEFNRGLMAGDRPKIVFEIGDTDKTRASSAAIPSSHFHRLDGWIVRRIWSHRYKRWRNSGWKRLPKKTLYREHGLVNIIGADSFVGISERLSLRESCIREKCTCSLSGGQRLARKRASSDPTLCVTRRDSCPFNRSFFSD
jgi:hypothetical protein